MRAQDCGVCVAHVVPVIGVHYATSGTLRVSSDQTPEPCCGWTTDETSVPATSKRGSLGLSSGAVEDRSEIRVASSVTCAGRVVPIALDAYVVGSSSEKVTVARCPVLTRITAGIAAAAGTSSETTGAPLVVIKSEHRVAPSSGPS